MSHSRSETKERRAHIEKKIKRHKRHADWIDDASDWREIESEFKREEWIYNKLYNCHDPKGWLLQGAEGEDAKNIGALILRVPPDYLSRNLAKLLCQFMD